MQRSAHLPFSMASLFAPVQEDGVDSNALEPGCESRLPAEGVELADDLEQDFLGDILGIGIVIQHTVGEVVDSWSESVENIFRC
jgi:hypothetical protein